MFFPSNPIPQTRPRVSQVHLDALSDSLTRGLQSIQERERNHTALISQAAATLPTLRPRFATLTTSDIDNLLQ